MNPTRHHATRLFSLSRRPVQCWNRPLDRSYSAVVTAAARAASASSSSSWWSPARNDEVGDGENRCRTSAITSQPYCRHRRQFHATLQREIVPFVAAGAAVFLVGRYSWKALNRMDDEWEDYMWRLQQYERERRKVEGINDIPITIGVDLGTIYLKLSAISGSQPELIETGQGDRYRFNGIWMSEEDNGSGDGDIVTGKMALDKFYYDPGQDDAAAHSTSGVVLPYTLLQGDTHEEAVQLVQKIFVPSVGEAMERVDSTTSSSNNNSGGGDTNEQVLKRYLRTVLALPPTLYNQHGETFFLNYQDDSHDTVTVPEPVAAVWGAQVLNLIPTPQSKEENASQTTLVMDVGGLASSVSIVCEDRVLSSVTLDNIGGESFVQELANRILSETGDKTMAKDPMSLTMMSASARASVLELISKTSSNVHIPFLFMGRKTDDPHLNMTISRTVLEQAVQDHWNTSVVPKLVGKGSVFSASLPTPTNAASLFTSAMTKVLEEGNILPTNVSRILVVGGGSKHRLFEEAARESVFALLGPSSRDALILPDTSQRAELTALGAASLLPNFDYDYNNGLERT